MQHNPDVVAIRLGVTRGQAVTVAALLSREVVSKDTLYGLHYDSRPECEWPQSDKVLDKHVCILRKRLKVLGADIANRWGVGWYITPEHRAKLEGLLNST